MEKHTSAPWRIRGNEIGKRIESDTQSHGMLALIATVDMYDFPEQAEANKLLIASAPALLGALECLSEAYACLCRQKNYKPETNLHYVAALAAIAAARGTV